MQIEEGWKHGRHTEQSRHTSKRSFWRAIFAEQEQNIPVFMNNHQLESVLQVTAVFSLLLFLPFWVDMVNTLQLLFVTLNIVAVWTSNSSESVHTWNTAPKLPGFMFLLVFYMHIKKLNNYTYYFSKVEKGLRYTTSFLIGTQKMFWRY